MRIILASIAALGFALPVAAQSSSSVLTIHSDYTAQELLDPCRQADSDARNGAPLEIECEQYLIGFVDALEVVGQVGPDHGICLPEVNLADEARWAYVRWIYGDYGNRTKMMAAPAVLGTLKEAFPCN